MEVSEHGAGQAGDGIAGQLPNHQSITKNVNHKSNMRTAIVIPISIEQNLQVSKAGEHGWRQRRDAISAQRPKHVKFTQPTPQAVKFCISTYSHETVAVSNRGET